MTSQTENVLQVNCSRALWPMLGWEWGAHPCEIQPYFELTEGRLLVADRIPAITSLVPTPWDYQRSIATAELVRVVKPRAARRARARKGSERSGTLKLQLVCGDKE
jgi:hypothetical protein